MSGDAKPTVVEALIAVMEDVLAVGKTGRNEQQGYSFRGVDAVVNAVGPAFRKHKVVAAPIKTITNYRDVEVGAKRTKQREATVTVIYRFHGPAGDHIDAEVPAEALDSGDKATSKAMSVAYRTVLLQVLTIPTDEADPDQTSVERSAAQGQVLNKGQAKYQLVEVAKTLTGGHEGTARQLAARAWTLTGGEGREEFDEGSMQTLTDLLHGLAQPGVREALEGAEGRQAARDAAGPNGPTEPAEPQSLVEASNG